MDIGSQMPRSQQEYLRLQLVLVASASGVQHFLPAICDQLRHARGGRTAGGLSDAEVPNHSSVWLHMLLSFCSCFFHY